MFRSFLSLKSPSLSFSFLLFLFGKTGKFQAGAVSEVRLVISCGQTVQWRFGTLSKDVVFSVEAIPVPAGVVLSGAIDFTTRDPTVAQYGVHDLAVASAEQEAWCSAAANTTVVLAAVRTNCSAGHWPSPVPPIEQSEAAAEHQRYCVRLLFDNSFSWLTGKTLARRVDVLPRANVAAPLRMFAVDHSEGMRLALARWAFWFSLAQTIVADQRTSANAMNSGDTAAICEAAAAADVHASPAAAAVIIEGNVNDAETHAPGAESVPARPASALAAPQR